MGKTNEIDGWKIAVSAAYCAQYNLTGERNSVVNSIRSGLRAIEPEITNLTPLKWVDCQFPIEIAGVAQTIRASAYGAIDKDHYHDVFQVISVAQKVAESGVPSILPIAHILLPGGSRVAIVENPSDIYSLSKVRVNRNHQQVLGPDGKFLGSASGVLRSIIKTMAEDMHSHHVVHGDFRPEHVAIRPPGSLSSRVLFKNFGEYSLFSSWELAKNDDFESWAATDLGRFLAEYDVLVLRKRVLKPSPETVSEGLALYNSNRRAFSSSPREFETDARVAYLKRFQILRDTVLKTLASN